MVITLKYFYFLRQLRGRGWIVLFRTLIKNHAIDSFIILGGIFCTNRVNGSEFNLDS